MYLLYHFTSFLCIVSPRRVIRNITLQFPFNFKDHVKSHNKLSTLQEDNFKLWNEKLHPLQKSNYSTEQEVLKYWVSDRSLALPPVCTWVKSHTCTANEIGHLDTEVGFGAKVQKCKVHSALCKVIMRRLRPVVGAHKGFFLDKQTSPQNFQI